ncbi:MAG: HNH endonuclease signature motif containing protein [Candidatus Baltobacteraceae bacterium]
MANNRYDWNAVQRHYDAGNSYRECRARFEFSAGAWTKAVDRGALRARSRGLPIRALLASSISRTNVKRRLLLEDLLRDECSECGLSEWRERKLSAQIDHINGNSSDNRLENLRMLCPNCHSQTSTFAGRNAKARKSLPGSPGVV